MMKSKVLKHINAHTRLINKYGIMLSMLFGSLLLSSLNELKAETVTAEVLTKNVILVHFDEGKVTYPNTLDVLRPDITKAFDKTSYAVDNGITISNLYRKSKGTEFVKDAPWGGNNFVPTSKPWASVHDIYLVLSAPLVSGTSYTVTATDIGTGGKDYSLTFTFQEESNRSEVVHTNTLGYGANAPKFSYLYHWMGTGNGLDLSGFDGEPFKVVNASDDSEVMAGTVAFRKAFDNRETNQFDTPNQNFLGADVYECDFSSLTAPGTYKVVVPGIGSSFEFIVGADPVWDAYYNVMRGLYHQRSGIELNAPYSAPGYVRPVTQNPYIASAGETPYSGKQFYGKNITYMEWDGTDNPSESQRPLIIADAASYPLEIAGWYHDAGDWDSYYTHHRIPILLMTTYEYMPQMFADSELNIPESGNGVPDIVDEASWLIKLNYRLRKELMAKGYSDGGVGGARICSDVYTDADGKTETFVPSWKETRRMVVTPADAFMTYIYAGQAAQFAYILKSLGKNPKSWPVELLDKIKFEDMSRDDVDWIKEAEEAFAWASKPENQPANNDNYSSGLSSYRAYAAVNLYRLTGKDEYHQVVASDLPQHAAKSSLRIFGDEDSGWGVFTYAIASNFDVDQELKDKCKASVLSSANLRGKTEASKRATRWANFWELPMLVGHGSTPDMFDNALAYSLTGNTDYKENAQHTADYFLGNNPTHTTWITGVGPRPLHAVFHLDSRYLYTPEDNWKTYPGVLPYGPWRISESEKTPAVGNLMFKYTIDGEERVGGHGPWHWHWWNYTTTPKAHLWPGHERNTDNIQSPMSTEFTIHQNTVHGAIAYGFVNGRDYTSDASGIGTITLDKATYAFTEKKESIELVPSLDSETAKVGQLVWVSSAPERAHVDNFGRVTALTEGEDVTITCRTLSSNASATCVVSLSSLADVSISKLTTTPSKSAKMGIGETIQLVVSIEPSNATDKSYTVTSSDPAIANYVDGKILAYSDGVATITVKSNSDNSIQEVIEVTVGNQGSFSFVTLADFDAIIPTKEGPNATLSHIFPNSAALVIDQANPNTSDPLNNSAKVAKFMKPASQWQLIGLQVPSGEVYNTNTYTELEFKYRGEGDPQAKIEVSVVDLKDDDNQTFLIDDTDNIISTNDWQVLKIKLPANMDLKLFRIWVTPRAEEATVLYVDDFKLKKVLTAVAIDQGSQAVMDIGEELSLTATAESSVSWSSDNTDVATVDDMGKVTAVSEGTATVTATLDADNNESAEIAITVRGPQSALEIIANFDDVLANQSGATDTEAQIFNAASLAESNPDTDGINGSAKVMKYDRPAGNWQIFGVVLPTGMTYSGDDFERFDFLYYGDGVKHFYVKITYNDASTHDNPWSAGELTGSNTWQQYSVSLPKNSKSIKQIDIFANPDATNATVPAATTIYFDDFVLVRPTIEVTSIVIDQGSTAEMTVEEKLTLTATIAPSNATVGSIKWSSDNTDVATVDESSGEVSALTAGVSVITATSQSNLGITASITITVAEKVPALSAGLVQKLNLFPNPSNGSAMLASSFPMQSVVIYGLGGNKVWEREIKGTEIRIDRLKQGIYFVNVIGEDGRKEILKMIVSE